VTRRTQVLFLLAVLLGGLLISTRSEAHTQAEQVEWYNQWAQDVQDARWLTGELIAERNEFQARHRTAGHRQGAVAASGSDRDAIAAVEGWRPLVSSHFNAENVDTMLCIMYWESRGVASAQNPTSSARGLFQILKRWGDPSRADVPYIEFFDAATNVELARYVWDRQGYPAWNPYRVSGRCRGL